jgi:cyanate permease
MPLDENERLKIEILLHEFRNRQEELISRYNAQFQAIGAVAIILGGFIAAIATNVLPKSPWVPSLMIFAFVVFVALFLWADNDISKAARRMREIERDINSRVGEDLLIWEIKRAWGGGLMQITINALKRLLGKHRNSSSE